ncbi:hypothetical protein KKF38_02785 [Patescibacteria group bacterium]|nr:hypothetical protein [Patescibacteria group bacterium]
MNKKLWFTTILFIAVLIFAVILLSQEENKNQPTDQQNTQSQIILFYGDGCPHCVIVEEYIERNDIEEKISFEQKEVYYNKNNANDLTDKAKMCGLPTDNVGVPFLWDGSECFVGDQEIIEFFKQQSNEK